jgi:hypothetical protein
MRPWTAGQNRFSLRISQMAQINERLLASIMAFGGGITLRAGRRGGISDCRFFRFQI